MDDEIITKIEIGKKNKKRVNVYINNEFSFSCSAEIIYTYNLKKDQKINLEELSYIVEEDNYIKGKSYALNLIEKSLRTEKDIKEKLYQRGYTDKNIDRIMKFLKEYNFVNDEKYTEVYIEEKINKWGRNKIKYELLKKGISEELILEKIDKIDQNKEYNTAFKIAEKKYRILKEHDKDLRKVKNKLGDFLIRKGYEFEIVNKITNELIQDEELNENYNIKNNIEKETYEEALKLAKKRYFIIVKSEGDKLKLYRKLYNYLARRGFPPDIIKNVLDEVI